jgi:multiple RNA-binding domain-containing protein 1
VGYKTAEDAQAAIKFFNKSYFDTARLELAMAESFKTTDKQQMRPWSKHSKSGTLDSAAHPHIGTTVVGGQTSGSNEKQDKQGKGGKRRKQVRLLVLGRTAICRNGVTQLFELQVFAFSALH